MGATVHIVAQFDDDSERWWFTECTPDDYDDSSRAFEGDVPADLWARRRAAIDAWDAADAEIADLLGLDECGRRREPCGEWHGDEFAGGPEFWDVVLAASPSGDEWPVIDVRIGWMKWAAGEAEAYIESLPDEFYLMGQGPAPVRVTKDRLSIVHHPATPPRWYECVRCGWPRDDHGAAR